MNHVGRDSRYSETGGLMQTGRREYRIDGITISFNSVLLTSFESLPCSKWLEEAIGFFQPSQIMNICQSSYH